MSKGKILDPITHMLKRPDMYIGNVKTYESNEWVCNDNDKNVILQRDMLYNNGIKSIIREIGSNIIDNKWRSDKDNNKMTKIEIHVSTEEQKITFINDGNVIPVQKFSYEKLDPKTNTKYEEMLYPSQVFFGEMRSGTNYDDTEERKTSGRNGVGAKLTNVYSKFFRVYQADGKKSFEQTYQNNARVKNEPLIKICKRKFTEISFIPDYQYFDYSFDQNLIDIIRYYAYEISCMTKLPVIFKLDKEILKIHIKNLTDFAKLHYTSKNILHITNKDGDEAVLLEIMQETEDYERDNISHSSFINGIQTKNGGYHCNGWRDAIIRPILSSYNKTHKVKASAKNLYPYFILFVRCETDKPSFTSQTKDQLAKTDSLVFTKPSTEQINKVMKWDFVNSLQSKLEDRVTNSLSKDIQTGRVLMGDKLKDAGWAGRKRTKEMGENEPILLITEGMSAKGFAETGIPAIENGHNIFGAYAIKGKFINVKGMKKMNALKHKEVKALMKVLGLEFDIDYSIPENREKLRYRSVCFLTDADDDGIHIRGLLLNFFYEYFKSLMNIGYASIISMSTPIVKCKVGKDIKLFYSNTDYIKFAKNNKVSNVEYFKGLAAIDVPDQKKFFKSMKLLNYTLEGDEDQYMNLGFNSKDSDLRKEWIKREVDGDFQYEGDISVSEFIDQQLVIYHKESINRAIPSIFDGFKESHRKIYYGININKIFTPEKVSQVGGSIQKNPGYHHGEASLYLAIIQQAKGYVGTNNIAFLKNAGNYGTRNINEAGAPRYIKTCLEPIFNDVFIKADELLYKHRYEDGEEAEWEYYFPIIPTILINGTEGIACAWSTTIPNYNVIDIINYLRNWINKKEENIKLVPYYRNYKGEIELNKNGDGWTSKGILKEILEKKEKGWWSISELPIGMSGSKCKKLLEKFVEDKYLVDIKEEHPDGNSILFKIKPSRTFIPDIDTKGNFTFLKGKHSFTNMVCLDSNGNPKRYSSPESIIEEWAPRRLELYSSRKEAQLLRLINKKVVASGKMKFISLVLDGSLDIKTLTEEELENYLVNNNFERVDGKFDYLLNIQMRMMTITKIESLKKEIQELIETIQIIKNTTPEKMWLSELDNLEKSYYRYIKQRVEG